MPGPIHVYSMFTHAMPKIRKGFKLYAITGMPASLYKDFIGHMPGLVLCVPQKVIIRVCCFLSVHVHVC